MCWSGQLRAVWLICLQCYTQNRFFQKYLRYSKGKDTQKCVDSRKYIDSGSEGSCPSTWKYFVECYMKVTWMIVFSQIWTSFKLQNSGSWRGSDIFSTGCRCLQLPDLTCMEKYVRNNRTRNWQLKNCKFPTRAGLLLPRSDLWKES